MSNWVKVVKDIATRTITVYILVCLAFHFVIDENLLMSHTLNHSMPAFEYIAEFSKGNERLKKKKLKKYVRYYAKVTKYMPNKADAYSILGFCYYYLGQEDRSVEYYKKALSLHNRVLSFHYNLGVIYFKSGKYQLAIEALEKAILADVKENINFLYSSKAYRPIVLLSSVNEEDIGNHFRMRYSQAYALLVLSHYHLEDYYSMRKKAAASINPNFSYQDFFYYYAGLGSFELKDYQQAILFFKESIKLNASYANSYYHVGLSLNALGKSQRSKNMFNFAMAYENNPEMNNLTFREDQINLQLY